MSEIGIVLLSVACFLSLTYVFLPLSAYKSITNIIFFCALLSMIILIYCHITNDFSLKNVYYYSHTTKPLLYKICGVWGTKEGSMLLWTLVLTFYLFLMEIFSNKNSKLKRTSLITESLICFCFLLLTLFESNPFAKMANSKVDGLGFNPILQDIGLAIHPPMLYMGYLGFSIPFSLSIAGLILNIEGNVWAKIVRPWILLSCSLLTLGISLGSWWAYRELGWGGFWFWDPVENVALIPWLISVALIHLLLVVQNFNTLRNFAILLTLITFILSITGTFLVRSGILTSVHTFTDDSKHGLCILVLLSVIITITLVIFIVFTGKKRTSAKCLTDIPGKKSTIQTKQRSLLYIKLILTNNLLFITAFFIVFVGTIYPVLLEYLTGEIISVSEPYYNFLFNPTALAILVLIIIGQYYCWHRNSLSLILYEYRFSFFITVSILPFIFHMKLMIIMSITISIALLVSLLEEYSKRICLFKIGFGESVLLARRVSNSYYAMIISHAGVAILVLGIAYSLGWEEKKESYLKIGSSITVNKFAITLRNLEFIKEKNFYAVRGTMDVTDLLSNRVMGEMTPEYRFYLVEGQRSIKSSIYHNLFSDIYIVIGEIDRSKSKIATKVYYKPGMSMIWLGSFLISIGFLLASFFSGKKNSVFNVISFVSFASKETQRIKTYKSMNKLS